MLFKITLGALVAATSVAAWQTYRLDAAKQRGVENKIELAACGARLTNLIEDLRSDAEIDNLPDDALTVVPPEWLLGAQN